MLKNRSKNAFKLFQLIPGLKGVKSFRGTLNPPLYRIRSGDYRIIYTINDSVLLILIIEVGHRKEIYHF